MGDLAGAIVAQPDPNGLRIGVVVGLNPLVINVQGGLISNAGSIRSARVNVGDTVAVFRQDDSWLMLGAVTAGPGFAIRVRLAAAAPTVLLTIPASLRRVELTWVARLDAALATQLMFFEVNADVSAVYSYTYEQVVNTTQNASGNRSQTGGFLGSVCGDTATVGMAGTGHAEFPGWDLLTFGLGYTFHSQAMGAAAASQNHTAGGGVYLNTTLPRTSLTMVAGSGNFKAGSEFVVEGWYS
jgi:hypothetical protein